MDQVENQTTPSPQDLPERSSFWYFLKNPPIYHRPLVTLVAVTFFLSALGTLVYFTTIGKGQLSFSPPPTATQKPVVPTSILPTSTPTSDVTANWKTYKNERLGFEFKYPSYWKDVECTNEPFCLYYREYSSLPFEKDYVPQGLGDTDLTFAITTKEDFEEYSNSIENNKIPKAYASGWEIIKVGGKNAIQSYWFGGIYKLETIIGNEKALISLSVELPIEPIYNPKLYYGNKQIDIEKSQSKIVEIQKGNIDSQTKKIVDDYNLLLSTFKFTDQNPWAAKIVIEIPSNWIRIDCDESINFSSLNPAIGARDCGTEPGAFIVNIFTAKFNEYEDQSIRNDPDSVFSDYKSVMIGGKSAIQFKLEVLQGQPAGMYKYTIIAMGDDSFLYVILNNSEFEAGYQQIINNLQFK